MPTLTSFTVSPEQSPEDPLHLLTILSGSPPPKQHLCRCACSFPLSQSQTRAAATLDDVITYAGATLVLLPLTPLCRNTVADGKR